MAAFTQAQRLLKFTMPLGDDGHLLEQFSGSEAMRDEIIARVVFTGRQGHAEHRLGVLVEDVLAPVRPLVDIAPDAVRAVRRRRFRRA